MSERTKNVSEDFFTKDSEVYMRIFIISLVGLHDGKFNILSFKYPAPLFFRSHLSVLFEFYRNSSTSIIKKNFQYRSLTYGQIIVSNDLFEKRKE